ncbi:MAG: hypothetical protein ACM3PP_06600 [Candidatus Saccharibacteria bacterium]
MSEWVYKRKVSREESSDSKLMVLKNELKKFPPIGTFFNAMLDGKPVTAKIEAVFCQCRGPEKPHDHYWVHFKEKVFLVAGNEVEMKIL